MTPAALTVAISCLTAYVDRWTKHLRPVPLAVEYAIEPRPLRASDPSWAWRTVRYDSIEKWEGKTWIGECKTTSSGSTKVIDHYLLHVQPLLSVALWGEKETQLFGPLAGILFDVICKPRGKHGAKALARKPMLLNDMRHALEWFKSDFTAWVMQSSAIRWDDQVERRIGSCIRPYGPCDYRELCLSGINARQKFQFTDGKPLNTWKAAHMQQVAPWL